MDKPTFEALAALYERDRDAFDRVRRELLEHAISNARPEFQRRLRGLQFQIDGIRRTSKNPLDCSMKMQNQVFKKLDELRSQILREDRCFEALPRFQNNIVHLNRKTSRS